MENKLSKSKSERIFKKTKSIFTFLNSWAKKFSGSLAIFCLIGLFFIPFVTQSAYIIYQFFVRAMIFSILAASWDFLAGYAGQVSFGHAAFLGIGAYTTAYFVVKLDYNFIIAILFGAIISVGVGLLIAIPSLRLKGPYFALGTLVFGLILFFLFLMPELSGYLGQITGVPRIAETPFWAYFINYGFMIVSLIILLLIGRSNLGTKLKAIRDDDKGAKASGINISKYKIIAFMISAFFAGIAGGLFVFNTRYVGFSTFGVQYSFYPVIFTALGGIATISGPALGAFVFIMVEEFLIEFGGSVYIALFGLSIVLLFIIRFASQGVLRPLLERMKDLWDIIRGK